MWAVAEDSEVKEIMKIGHTNQSMTFVPDVASDDVFTYADCPGFLDNRGPEINIANAVNIKTMIHRATSVRVVVLVNYNSLMADRGRGVRDLTSILTDLFGHPKNLLRYAPSILLGVSRVQKRDDEGEPIELEHIRDLMSDTAGMSEDMEKCVAELRERIFLYHPSDDGNTTWLKRDEIIQRIQELEAITDPSSIFRTVLNVDDEKVRIEGETRNTSGIHNESLSTPNSSHPFPNFPAESA